MWLNVNDRGMDILCSIDHHFLSHLGATSSEGNDKWWFCFGLGRMFFARNGEVVAHESCWFVTDDRFTVSVEWLVAVGRMVGFWSVVGRFIVKMQAEVLKIAQLLIGEVIGAVITLPQKPLALNIELDPNDFTNEQLRNLEHFCLHFDNEPTNNTPKTTHPPNNNQPLYTDSKSVISKKPSPFMGKNFTIPHKKMLPSPKQNYHLSFPSLLVVPRCERK